MSQTVGSNNNRVYRLVLTGGPHGGKTTGQARLSTFFESIGWKVYRVPETPSIMMGGGVKSSDSSPTDAASTKFYGNLLKIMIQLENTYFDLASTCKENCLIICDGGTMDIRARVSESQWQEIQRNNRWNDVELRDSRYNQVVHMVSIASSGRRRHFSKHEGMDAVTASKLDSSISQAWVGHPYFDVIDNSTDFDRKLMRMIAAVCDRLNIHVGDRLSTDSYKRKFLVTKLPDDLNFPQFKDFIVVHDYLITPNQKMQARIRRRGQYDVEIPMPDCCVRLDANALETRRVFIHGTDNDLNNWTYTHTIRCPLIGRDSPEVKQCQSASSCSSPELKMQVTSKEYELLLAQKDTDHCTVFKTRRCFLWNNQYFQLDIYKEPSPKRCKGLMLLETYTSNKGDDFNLPDFLDIKQEVTRDPAYSMYNLSKKKKVPTATLR